MRDPDKTVLWTDAEMGLHPAPAAGNGDTGSQPLADLARRFGFSHFMIARVPHALHQTFKVQLADSNWPDYLVDAYDAAAVFASSALVRALSATRLPVFNEGCLLAETGDAETDERVAGLFAAHGLTNTLGIQLSNSDGEVFVLVLSGLRAAPSRSETVEFTYAALELFEIMEKNETVNDMLRDDLSTREVDCLRLAADGRSSDDIAILLGISALAVSSYFKSATEKLEAVNRMQAVARAMRLKLI